MSMYVGRWGGPGNQPLEGASAVRLAQRRSGEGGAGVVVAAQTTVPLRWVSDRLKMGHYTRVTQALSRMERHPARKLKHLRQRLERALPSEQ